ncbi:MAG: DNA/RNA non-specific endonuclease, partial [Gemmatimonadaceae bacterium]|nr:DNA/RNA non-specific endonuclease [Acetobacteraceae bacterium]
PAHFAAGRPPTIRNARLLPGARALCFDAFAVLHSAATRTPLYAAERLTAARVRIARRTIRDSEFHAEPALPANERADLADYARSGFDRGHLAPSGDMPGDAAQQQSFSLANIVPQVPQLNRGRWEQVERVVRGLAVRRGELYVVTGPLFLGRDLATVGRVAVPTHVWKAVLDPRRRAAGAWVAENVEDGAWRVVSLAQLSALTGLDVFPGAERPGLLRLPAPGPRR